MGKTEFSNSRWLIKVVLSVIVITGALLRFYKLGSKDFWLDEYVIRSYASYDYSSLWNHFYLDGNLSYPVMIQKYFLGLFPENEFYMRLPSAILSIASILSLYLMGTAFYGVREALVAAILLSFSFFHISMAQEYKLAYVVSTTFYPLTLYALFKGMEKGYHRYWLLFIISIFVQLYTHFLTIPSLFSIVGWVGLLFILFIFKPSADWQKIYGCALSYNFFLKFAGSIGLILAGCLPLLFGFRSLLLSPYGFGARAPSDTHFREVVNVNFFLNLFQSYSGSELLAIIFAAMVICWLIVSFTSQKNLLVGCLLLFSVFIPFAAYWVANPAPPLYNRYFIYILPIYLLIVAKGIVSLFDLFLKKWTIRNHAGIYILFSIATLISLFNCKPLWTYYHEEITCYKNTAIYMLDNIENDDLIFYRAQLFDVEGLLYYLDRFGKNKIYILPRSIGSFPYLPYIFRPLEKRTLLTPGQEKKGTFLIYAEKKDIESLTKSLPNEGRFWFISSKPEPELSRLGIERAQYSQTPEKFIIYRGRKTE